MMKQRIRSILMSMCEGLYERDEVIALSVLSALADESIFLLGHPGVGKSLVARRLKAAFADARSFEYLMSRFSTPDEIFGPVSITKLKEADTYQRITNGYMPESEIVFLDEIWKAGPAIQNSLLTVLNEKVYLNGNKLMHLPIKAIIAASNELPAEGEGLEALWDRFLIRYIVEPIAQRRNFESLLSEQGLSVPTDNPQPLTKDECALISEHKCKVVLPKQIIDVVYNLRKRLIDKMYSQDSTVDDTRDESMKYYISDRRWKKAVGVMRTSALLNDRREVDFSDVMLLTHMLWNEDTQLPEIQMMVCEETVAQLFKTMLDVNKSSKRHALKRDEIQLYTPDNIHYIAICDGVNLKIRIDDYRYLLKSGDYRLASESVDECIVLMDSGSYAVQVNKAGHININGYNYPLRTAADPQITTQQLNTMADGLEGITKVINSQISDNIFASDERFMPMIRTVASEYAKKLKK